MKKTVLFSLCVFLIVALCACFAMNKTPDEETILSDYIEKDVNSIFA